MQVGGPSAFYFIRSAFQAARAASPRSAEDKSRQQQALEMLQQSDGQVQGWARAQQKLADAKARIEYLRRWGFPASVIAEQASQIAAEISAAARDFASLVHAGRTGAVPGPASSEAIVSLKQPDNGQLHSLAERGYGEIIRNDGSAAVFSEGDRRAFEALNALQQQLRRLLEEAGHRAQAQGGDARLVALVTTADSGLQGALSEFRDAVGAAAQASGFGLTTSNALGVNL